MYIPKHFEIKDENVVRPFLEKNPFGMLISNDTTVPACTHLPFLILQDSPLCLLAHMARVNPHCKILQSQNNCLLVFNGPHGYVSPDYYKNPRNVPTWNYTTIHLQAIAKEVTEKEKIANLMEHTSGHFDPTYHTRYHQIDESYIQGLLKEVSVFEFSVIKSEIKFKLNQNKSAEDIHSVISHLEKSNNPDDQSLATFMKSYYENK